MKKLKNITRFLLVTIIFISVLIVNVSAKSNDEKTLSELEKDLSSLKAQKSANDNKKKQTQSQINNNKATISTSQSEIETNYTKIENAKIEIQELDNEIKANEQEIKDIISAYQLTNKKISYLEYIFGAKSISDFLIRLSVTEQVTSYNEEKIIEYKNKIDENEKLQVDLKNREVELNNKINELEKSIQSLGNDLTSLIDTALSIDDEIKSAEASIKKMKELGCTANQTYSQCISVKGDSAFVRPLVKGTKTSDYGYRTHPVTGQLYKFHSGVDIGGNSEGTNVYSVASGTVGKIIYKASCGGNQVYVWHTINGVKYTSVYMHLKTINVSLHQSVTNQTVVGTVGGGASTMSYDGCSTGAHLHLSLAKGWYGSTYTSYSTYTASLVNPVNYVSIPNYGKWFYSRW